MKWQQFLDGWGRAQQLEAVKQIARNTAPPKPTGKYQRLPDGTWGYPPEETGPSQAETEAFERGWRAGWESGYAQAMALVQNEIEAVKREPART